MATYSQAVDQVISELGRNDTSITAVIQQAMLAAIEHYSLQRFWFNEARVSFTASSTIYYPLANLSSALMEIDQVCATVSGSVVELDPASHADIQAADISGYTGPPSMWALFGEQMRLFPKPAAGVTYQIDVDGTKRIPTLSATSDTNEWLREGLDLILARVEKTLCARRFKDYEAAQVYQAAENQALDRLFGRTERLISTGRLKGG